MSESEIKIVKEKGAYWYDPKKSGKLLSAKEMAEFAGVSETAFHKSWSPYCPKFPNPTNPTQVVYPSAAVMKWRFDKDMEHARSQLIGKVETSEDEMTIVEADRRKKQADAYLAELKVVKELEQVANIADLMANFGVAAENIAATILGWKANLLGSLVMQEEEVIEQIFDEEIARLLANLKEYKHEYAPAEE